MAKVVTLSPTSEGIVVREGDLSTFVSGVVLVNPATGEAYAASGGGGGGLTNAELRATAVPVSNTQLPAALGTRGGLVAEPTGGRRTATITRAANVTAYTAGDVVGGVLTFAAVAAAGGTMTIMSVDLMWDMGVLVQGASTLHLYSVTPPSAYADNAAWDLGSGDRAAYIGSIAIGTPVDLGSTLFVTATPTAPFVVQLGAAETALYGYLVTGTAYTPAANSETGKATLRGYVGA